MNTFTELVYKDVRLRSAKNIGKSSWVKIYALAAVLLVFILNTYALIKGKSYPWFLYGFPMTILIIAYFTSFGIIRGEWRQDSHIYWLSLPYPREYLMRAKFSASFVRMLQVIAIFIAAFAAVWVEGMILCPSIWNIQSLMIFLKNAGISFIWVAVLSPAIIAAGMMMGVLSESKLRPITPLLWIFTPMVLSLLSAPYTVTKEAVDFEQYPNFIAVQPLPTLIIIAAGIILFCLFYALSSYLLEHQVEL
jgi:hypothetical protein